MLLAVLFAARALARPTATDPGLRDQPNIVLIMADDLGWGDLGCYGQKKIRAPRLDRLAAEGIRFTDYYAASPVCAPTRCMLLTGLHAGHALIRDNREVGEEGQEPFPAGLPTIGTWLKASGYATGIIGKWASGGPGSIGEPGAHGFDFSYGFLCQRQAHNHYPTHAWRCGKREDLPGNTRGNLTGGTYIQDRFIAESLDFIRTNKARPFFLYLPWTIPHLALQAPPQAVAEYKDEFSEIPYDGKKGYLPTSSPRATYAAMITRMDHDVGRIVDLLGELNLTQDTIILFCSDNGATFDIGGADTVFFSGNGPFRGYKGSVWEGGIRVPLIAWSPGRIPAARVSDLPCISYDLPVTFLALAGASTPPALDGISLAPTLLGRGEQPHHEFFYWELPSYGHQQALRMDNIKAVRRDMANGNSEIQIYDLAADPAETVDLADTRPELVVRAREIMSREHVASAAFPLKGVD